MNRTEALSAVMDTLLDKRDADATAKQAQSDLIEAILLAHGLGVSDTEIAHMSEQIRAGLSRTRIQQLRTRYNNRRTK